MKLVGAGGQQVQHFLYDASGVVVTGGVPQLVLPKSMARSFLLLQNLSSDPMYFEIGSARAVATVSGGVVTGVSISSPAGATNAGFNFTNPPVVQFIGGGSTGNSSYLGLGQPNGASPSHPAKAHAVLTGNAVSSIVIDDPGAGYVCAPYVLIYNSDLDPNGCAVPTAAYSLLLPAQSAPLVWNGTTCPTDPIAVLAATTGDAFVCKYMD